MDSKEQETPRRPERTRKRTSKGEEYDESLVGSSPVINSSSSYITSHRTTADTDFKLETPRSDKKFNMLAGSSGTKRAAEAPEKEPIKKPRRSSTARETERKQSGPTSTVKKPSQNEGRAPPDLYGLPSFEYLLVGDSMFEPDEPPQEWDEVEGNVNAFRNSSVNPYESKIALYDSE